MAREDKNTLILSEADGDRIVGLLRGTQDGAPGPLKYRDEPAPFGPESAAREKERSRRSHKDVTRGEFEDQQKRLEGLEDLVKRLANNLSGFAKRQVEMRADLLKAGAFEKKSSIITDLN